MGKQDILALDKLSVRSKSVDGQLFIEVSPISKACVSPYLGSEIPDPYNNLGLQVDKVYNLLRCPVELASAAESFRGIPILFIHKATSAEDHPKEITVGSVGTVVEFNAPYLEASLSIWTEEAIAGIESKQQTEISSGYHYTADMTPGVYEGQPYDGVMRNIQGNHIALVDVGRAGPDVVVMDSKPLTLRTPTMATKPVKLSRTAAAINSALRVFLTPKLAQDAAIGSLGALLADVNAATLKKQRPEIVRRVTAHMKGKLAQDANLDDIDAAMDAAADDPDLAEDEDDESEEDRKKRLAKDAEPPDPDKDKVSKGAMDAAIAKASATATINAIQATNDLHAARKDVAPLVGEVALDSAEAVYEFALKQAKIDITGVHPSAYRTLVTMAKDRAAVAATATPILGMDAATVTETAKLFPSLGRIKHA